MQNVPAAMDESTFKSAMQNVLAAMEKSSLGLQPNVHRLAALLKQVNTSVPIDCGACKLVPGING